MISEEQNKAWLKTFSLLLFKLRFSLREIVQLNGFQAHEIFGSGNILDRRDEAERTFQDQRAKKRHLLVASSKDMS
jgi:hypothetical protein